MLGRLQLVVGDITTFVGDAVVNPANNAGLGGGGCDGAIHKAAGPTLYDACWNLPTYDTGGMGPGFTPVTQIRVKTGYVAPTPACGLPCKWVFHTVGPRNEDVGMPSKLRSCIDSAMHTAIGLGLQSIAFPAISTGVYGVAQKDCAEITLKALRDPEIDCTVYLFTQEDLDVWVDVARRLSVDVEVC